MKRLTPLLFLVVLALVRAGLCAEALDWRGDFSTGGGPLFEKDVPVPLAPHSMIFPEFTSRVEAAIKSEKLAEIRALYQTNGIAAEEMNLELARWRPIFDQHDKKRVSLFFKELSSLPFTAARIWGEDARRLTTHKVTHLAFLRYGDAVRLILPLVSVDGSLLVVSSDKVKWGTGIEPGGAANRSQPIRSETNRTSAAAGSDR